MGNKADETRITTSRGGSEETVEQKSKHLEKVEALASAHKTAGTATGHTSEASHDGAAEEGFESDFASGGSE